MTSVQARCSRANQRLVPSPTCDRWGVHKTPSLTSQARGGRVSRHQHPNTRCWPKSAPSQHLLFYPSLAVQAKRLFFSSKRILFLLHALRRARALKMYILRAQPKAFLYRIMVAPLVSSTRGGLTYKYFFLTFLLFSSLFTSLAKSRITPFV